MYVYASFKSNIKSADLIRACVGLYEGRMWARALTSLNLTV